MKSLLNDASSSSLSGGQIAIIIIVSVLLALAVVLSIFLIFLFKKKNSEKGNLKKQTMETKELQEKYDTLLTRLNSLKNGLPVEELSPLDMDESTFLLKIQEAASKQKNKTK